MKSTSNNTPLTVKPVKKYKSPKYPGYNNPNPLEEPSAPAYPFSRQFLRYLAGIGLITFGQNLAGQSAVDAKTSLTNPFPRSGIGLPYMPVMFGTGMPDRLSEKNVRAAVMNAFAAEGLACDTAYLWQEKESQVLLDAYDTDTKIGFVYTNYHRLGTGTIKRGYDRSRIDRVQMGEYDWLQQIEDNFLPNRRGENWLKNKLRRLQKDERLNEKKEEYEGYIQRLKKKKKVPRLELENMLIDFNNYGDFSDYANQLLNQALLLPLGKERSELLRQFSLLQGQQQTRKVRRNGSRDQLKKNLQNLANQLSVKPYLHPGHPEKWININAVADLINKTRSNQGDDFQEELYTAIEAATNGNWQALADVQRVRNPLMIDMFEIEQMIEKESEEEDQILVLSGKENIMIIPGVGVIDPSTQESLLAGLPDREEVEKMSKEKQVKYRLEVRTRYWEHQKKMKAAAREEQLKRLEAQVRSFIQWAKREGRF